LQIQPKLLKVLEEKRFRRVGDVRDKQVDVRLLAATHQDLSHLVSERRFRDDLYFRISTIPLTFPPLRNRTEDIPLLAESLLEKFAANLGRGELQLSEEGLDALQSYSWPGNVRELRNVIERAVLLSEHKTLGLKDLHFDGRGGAKPTYANSNLTLMEVERQHIEHVLAEENGSVERAAKRLGVPRSSLYEKLKRHRLMTSRF